MDIATTFAWAWYRDLDDSTRAWANRSFDRTDRMPNDNRAALYSSVLHYLEAVKTATTRAPSPRR
jgi:branched-chain amino acid transport system substrate-binding protein